MLGYLCWTYRMPGIDPAQFATQVFASFNFLRLCHWLLVTRNAVLSPSETVLIHTKRSDAN